MSLIVDTLLYSYLLLLFSAKCEIKFTSFDIIKYDIKNTKLFMHQHRLQIKSNKNFNKLLIGLAVVDSILIFELMIEMSIIGAFVKPEPLWFTIIYPYIVHPGKGPFKLYVKLFWLISYTPYPHFICYLVTLAMDIFNLANFNFF